MSVAVEPPAALDELEDEHAAAVRVSSKTAVAPAAGFAKDRFIPAPSRDFWVRLPVLRWQLCPRGPACSASGNLSETYGLILQQLCHRCQYHRPMIYYRA